MNEQVLALRAADGTGEVKELASGREPNVSPDGKFLAFCQIVEGSGGDLFFFPLDGAHRAAAPPQVLLHAPFNQYEPRFSPDGHIIASGGKTSTLTVVQSWFAEFRDRAKK